MPLLPILLTSTLFTQGPPPPRPEAPPSPLLQLADYLKLEPEQLAQAKTKLQQHEGSLQTKRKAAQQARANLEEALRDPATSEARLKELHEKAASAHFSELSERHAMLKEQVALLTPEQSTKLKAALPLLKALEPLGRPPRPDHQGPEGRPARGEEADHGAPPPFRAPHPDAE